MLVGNGIRLNSNPMRQMGTAFANTSERSNWQQRGATLNLYAGEATVIAGASIANKSAIPNGYLHPNSWQLPIKSGGMACYVGIVGSNAVNSANLAGALLGGAALTGSGNVTNADLRLYGILVAALVAGGDVNASVKGSFSIGAALTGLNALSAAVSASLNANASLSGSGSLSAGMVASLLAFASVNGSGNVSANMTGVIQATANLLGSGAISLADIHGAFLLSSGITGSGNMMSDLLAIGYASSGILGVGGVTANGKGPAMMSASISSSGDLLTSASVAQAVWEYFNRTLTGSGGLSSEQNQRLEELWQVLGLDATKPVTVMTNRRFVGDTNAPDVDQTIGGNGRTISTITRLP